MPHKHYAPAKSVTPRKSAGIALDEEHRKASAGLIRRAITTVGLSLILFLGWNTVNAGREEGERLVSAITNSNWAELETMVDVEAALASFTKEIKDSMEAKRRDLKEYTVFGYSPAKMKQYLEKGILVSELQEDFYRARVHFEAGELVNNAISSNFEVVSLSKSGINEVKVVLKHKKSNGLVILPLKRSGILASDWHLSSVELIKHIE